MIKEIIAIIRPGKWTETLVKLEEVGVIGVTRQRVYGRGKQRGLRYGNEDPTEKGISFLPKWMVTLVVENTKMDAVIEIILQTNRTGEIGDGKVFVCPVLDSVRIRTNENREHALR
jgi:nitrogen regulatory protein PII 2